MNRDRRARHGRHVAGARTAHCPRMVQHIPGPAETLTSFEVAQLLATQQRRRNDEEAEQPLPGARRGHSGFALWQAHTNAAAIAEEVMAYLDNTTDSHAQTAESIRSFIEAVKPFNLTRMETFSLVNTPPRSVVEVHLLIEEAEERLSDDDVRTLLRLCQQLCALPRARP